VNSPSKIHARAWMIAPLCALVFFALTSSLRLRRVEYLSEVVGHSADAGRWRPRLIVPGHHNESFEWLDQTRQMISRRELRVRHVDYENAPSGRDVSSASPYRWWLGLLAVCHHELTRAPAGRSVEWAALVSDPLLLLLLGAGTAVLVARRFGTLAAALLSAALATLFPFAAQFTPGMPDDRGLAQFLALWSVLPLLVAIRGFDGPHGASRTRRWFFAAGVTGGLGLWMNVTTEAPALAGISLGALLVAWCSRASRRPDSPAPEQPLPWRSWALGGAVTCLGAYLIEYFPSYMDAWELRANHPVLGVAWLGAGEAVSRLSAWIRGDRQQWGLKGVAACVLAAAALASVPATLWLTHSLGFLIVDLSSMRLSLLPDSPAAQNLWAWLLQNGFTPAIWATVLPLALVAPALFLLSRPSVGAGERRMIALCLGPVAVSLGFAFREIGGWSGVDSALLLLVVALAAAVRASASPRLVAWTCGIIAAALLVPCAVQLWPSMGARDEPNGTEVVGLVERDLAYWLADHVGHEGAIVLAPPSATTALYYYGGIRGLGTFDWESRDGIRAAVRIVSALTPEESLELITRRGITHIVIPRWDPYMDAYARIGEGQVGSTFLERLHLWMLPPWLRPIPYLIPTIAGFEGQSVSVMEVVDEQDDATSASRLAEYFIDMGQLDLAVNAGQALRRFPADLGVQLARAQIAIAVNDADETASTMEVLLRRISGGEDRDLPWDQRVSLTILLAQTHHLDLAHARLRQCLDEVDDEKLRSLSTSALYRLRLLQRALGEEIKDPRLRSEAIDLLPPDLRSKLSE